MIHSIGQCCCVVLIVYFVKFSLFFHSWFEGSACHSSFISVKLVFVFIVVYWTSVIFVQIRWIWTAEVIFAIRCFRSRPNIHVFELIKEVRWWHSIVQFDWIFSNRLFLRLNGWTDSTCVVCIFESLNFNLIFRWTFLFIIKFVGECIIGRWIIFILRWCLFLLILLFFWESCRWGFINKN